jgi:quinol monooxygenase YgiN
MMFTCKVKPGEVDRNVALLEAAFEELEQVKPAGLRYVTYRLDDGVTFVGFVEMAGDPSALRDLPAFQRYRSTLEERCEEPPVMTVLHQVGSYDGLR